MLTLRVLIFTFFSLFLLTSCGGGASIGVAASDAQAASNSGNNTSIGIGTSTINSADTLNFSQLQALAKLVHMSIKILPIQN